MSVASVHPCVKKELFLYQERSSCCLTYDGPRLTTGPRPNSKLKLPSSSNNFNSSSDGKHGNSSSKSMEAPKLRKHLLLAPKTNELNPSFYSIAKINARTRARTHSQLG